jgi:hypothetical protein
MAGLHHLNHLPFEGINLQQARTTLNNHFDAWITAEKRTRGSPLTSFTAGMANCAAAPSTVKLSPSGSASARELANRPSSTDVSSSMLPRCVCDRVYRSCAGAWARRAADQTQEQRVY